LDCKFLARCSLISSEETDQAEKISSFGFCY
jgi:hypothetical protein